MLRHLLMVALIFLIASPVMAAPRDLIGGSDGTTQTISHCGYLPTSPGNYTASPVTTRIVQEKLSKLGFYRGPLDGVYGKSSKAAVRAFQADYNLSADGVVGPITAQRLAHAAHNSRNVRRCSRMA